MKDLWHYARLTLAKQTIQLFETNLSSALVFFAPRRMGKTEFLRKDIVPYASKKDWHVMYFSFLEAADNPRSALTQSLISFAESLGAISSPSLLSRVDRVGGSIAGVAAGIHLKQKKSTSYSLQKIFKILSQSHRVLLLLDEIQALAKYKNNETFIAGLRTALDMYKDHIKVIFTGSSREGLRQMFSQASAPFFHFGQNLPFPELGREFTDHLASVFVDVTKRQLNADLFWKAFLEMDRVPQLARALIERLVLYPNQTIMETKIQLLQELHHDRTYVDIWENLSSLERLLLQTIAHDPVEIFSEVTRAKFAKKLGVDVVGVPAVQSVIRTLHKKLLIGKLDGRANYFIDDPNFKSWILNRE